MAARRGDDQVEFGTHATRLDGEAVIAERQPGRQRQRDRPAGGGDPAAALVAILQLGRPRQPRASRRTAAGRGSGAGPRRGRDAAARGRAAPTARARRAVPPPSPGRTAAQRPRSAPRGRDRRRSGSARAHRCSAPRCRPVRRHGPGRRGQSCRAATNASRAHRRTRRCHAPMQAGAPCPVPSSTDAHPAFLRRPTRLKAATRHSLLLRLGRMRNRSCGHRRFALVARQAATGPRHRVRLPVRGAARG